MALLGEGWDDPKSGAIMALSAGLLGRNFAGGLLGANQAYAQAKQAQRQAAFDQMKMDAFREELALKKAQAAKKDQGLAMLASVLGTGEPAYQPGQLGSGTFGVVGNADPMAAPARRAGGLANATPEQIAMLKAQGYDLVEPWKVAKQGFEQKPGSFRVDPTTNRREYIEDPKEGYTYRDGRVGNIPGFTEAQMQRTLATEAPKAILQSAGRVNLRTLPDGSQAPVPELSENPMLQDMMRLLYGVSPVPPAPVGGPVNQPPSTPRERVPVRGSGAGDPPAGSGMIAPQTSADRLGILQKSLDQARAGLNAPGVNDMDKSRLMQDIRDIEGEMANMQRVNGRPAPIATAQSSPSQGRYGKTTAQETAEQVDRTRQIEQAKADVKPTEQVQTALRQAQELRDRITDAINHSGRAGATGLSSWNPFNKVPGTSANDFNVLLEQIKGKTFLNAFGQLKGGGAITEKEGEAATAAEARLKQTQSEEAFLKSLLEYRDIVDGYVNRLKGAKSPDAPPSADGWDIKRVN